MRVSLDLTAHSESIAACHRAQQWLLALDMMTGLDQNSLYFDATMCNMAINICETGRRWSHALYLFKTAERLSVDLDVVTITSVISACESCGRWQLALSLFHQVPARRLEPNGWTYRTVISACIAGERTRWAFKLLRDMTRQALEGAVIALNDAITQFGQSAHWQQALTCSSKLACHGLQFDAVTYTSLTSSLAKSDRWRAVLQQLGAMKELKLEVNYEVRSTNAALGACSHSWPCALALFQDLNRQRLCTAITYTNLMTICGRSGQWEIALALLVDVEGPLPYLSLWVHFLKSLSSNAHLEPCAAAAQCSFEIESVSPGLFMSSAADVRAEVVVASVACCCFHCCCCSWCVVPKTWLKFCSMLLPTCLNSPKLPDDGTAASERPLKTVPRLSGAIPY